MINIFQSKPPYISFSDFAIKAMKLCYVRVEGGESSGNKKIALCQTPPPTLSQLWSGCDRRKKCWE